MTMVDWSLLAPQFVLCAFALVVLFVRAVRGRHASPDSLAAILAALGCGVAIAVCATLPGRGRLWSGMFVWDDYAAFFTALFACASMLVAVASVKKGFPGEFHCLLLLCTVGLSFMAASASLLMVFLGLELAAVCLFVLSGFDKADRRSSEAAVKFLTVGGSASAMFLFGTSLLFGAAGSTKFEALRNMMNSEVPTYAWFGAVLVIAGFGFKVTAAPFHLWAPDVYEGSPSYVTAFLSTASKAAALVALVRLLVDPLAPATGGWLPIILALAVLTIVLGNLVAVVQTNIKRLLAYSGVAQVGFLLVAVAALASPQAKTTAATALGLYLLLYVFANIGAFLCVQAVSEQLGDHHLRAYQGLSRRNGPLAFAFLILLLSLAGVPPMAGFVGKWFLFTAGVRGGLWWLVLLAAVASTVSLYYYLIVAKRMYIDEPADDRHAIRVPFPLAISIGVCVAMTALIGIYPAPWLELARSVVAAL